MKVLIATDFYKNNLGGVTTSILSLKAGLNSLGHEVKVLTLSENIRSYRDGNDYYIGSLPAYYSPGVRMSFKLNDLLIKQIEDWNPDIIHLQSEGTPLLMALEIHKKCNTPIVMTCHTDYAYFVFGDNKDLFINRMIASLASSVVYRHAEKLIVPSRKALSFSFLKEFRDKMVVIPNGIELHKYDKKLSDSEKRQLKKDLGINDSSKILMAASRLSKEKNLEELIDYLPELLKKEPETILMIVGEGVYYQYLLNRAIELDIKEKVIFTGRIRSVDMYKYYSLADIFVSASIFEVHSMTYLEALAQGLPLLCRKDDALIGVLRNSENGFVYENQAEFVRYAHEILSDENLKKKMREKSLEISKEFSAENFALAVAKLYEQVIDKED